MLAGAVPFGLIYGVLAVKAGIPPVLAIAVSFVIFAGSAQFMVTQLVAAGTPSLLIVLSVFIINLRHALYSAALAGMGLAFAFETALGRGAGGADA